MRAGPMRYRIKVLALPTDQDSGGQPITGQPALFLETAAAIRTVSSKEIYRLGPGFQGQVTHAITIRYPDKLPSAGMKILFRNRTFLLQTCSDPDERMRELDLMVLEKTK